MKVKCIELGGNIYITLGKEYEVISMSATTYNIMNNGNKLCDYYKYFFEEVTENSVEVKPRQEDIVKPKRYNRKGKLECWDVIIDQEMNFLEGSCLKYLWRYKEKNGVQDLRKLIEYAEKLILEEEKNIIK